MLALLLLTASALSGACGDDAGTPAVDQRSDRKLTDARPHTEPVVDAFVPPDLASVDAAVLDSGVADAAVDAGAGG